ncbi:MAG: SURF1 family protein [Stenotrophomonas chelatiphaga]|jgi:surfeit locus 1 family protein|uniref:SURF1 family protein n=1 Tax=Stenotrophomonas TaxID=40323 RepID=UPI000F4CFD3A|nr:MULTISPECIES: SURF1 family protein [Stenotrophomonas]MCS4231066.1 cytochrome oxidase assembly protein ShyY1 [Stenotrophomonas chelatiphaga]MDR6096035.1 surfeit locus 1 family protein [Stenotrophomonas sp. SORGH_AS_0321]ROQ38974.1 cytochrome oxidase assembly protein ShyY1 [Stenotrophomonas maltophilia]
MMRRHTRLLGWMLALVAMAVFCLLGCWQLQRMQQKQALLQAQAAAAAQPPSTLSRALAAAGPVHGIVDHGRFLPGLVLLDNQMRHGRAGVKVYRPFRSDEGALLLVDLGWRVLPADRTLPVLPPPPSPVAVRGLLAPAPAPGLALGPVASPAGPQRWLASRLQSDALAPLLGLPGLPTRVLRLDPALPFGDERDLDLLPNTLPPQRHLGYAVQWFGLALTVLVVALVLEWRRRRR